MSATDDTPQAGDLVRFEGRVISVAARYAYFGGGTYLPINQLEVVARPAAERPVRNGDPVPVRNGDPVRVMVNDGFNGVYIGRSLLDEFHVAWSISGHLGSYHESRISHADGSEIDWDKS
jgi:hypothetical protein